MKTSTVIVCVTGLFLYLTFGGFIFHLLESSDDIPLVIHSMKVYKFRDKLLEFNPAFTEEDLARLEDIYHDALHTSATTEKEVNKGADDINITMGNKWDFYNSFFVATTIVTTIGYGHMAPVTTSGQVFCCIYALFGIPLFMIAAAGVGVKLKGFANALSRRSVCNGDHPLSHLAEISRGAILIVLALVIFLMIPAFMVHTVEGWTFWTGFYFSYITLTTIGFGDFVAGQGGTGEWTSLYRMAISLWILVGLAWMASFISEMTDIYYTIFGVHTQVDKTKDPPDPPDDESMDQSEDEQDRTRRNSGTDDDDCVSMATEESNYGDVSQTSTTDDVIFDMEGVEAQDAVIGDAEELYQVDDEMANLEMDGVQCGIENEAFNMELENVVIKMR